MCKLALTNIGNSPGIEYKIQAFLHNKMLIYGLDLHQFHNILALDNLLYLLYLGLENYGLSHRSILDPWYYPIPASIPVFVTPFRVIL